jgi:hypothetical protein
VPRAEGTFAPPERAEVGTTSPFARSANAPMSHRDLPPDSRLSPVELAQQMDQGLWRKATRENALLMLYDALHTIKVDTPSGLSKASQGEGVTALQDILEKYAQLVEVDPDAEFRRRAEVAISLALQGEERKSLELIEPYLQLGENDCLSPAACELAAWVNFRLRRFGDCLALLERCVCTEKVLYLKVCSQLNQSLYDKAKGTFSEMDRLYPEGEFTRRLLPPMELRKAIESLTRQRQKSEAE